MAKKKKLHKKSKVIKLRKYDRRYSAANSKRDEALKKLAKPPTKLQRLSKPYEIHYYKTRYVKPKTGKVSYKRRIRFEEQTRKPYIQRGILHRIDYISKNRIHSDKIPKKRNLVSRTVRKALYKTALGAETGTIAATDIAKNALSSSLKNKVRQEAQDDASKAAVKVGGTSAAAALGTVSHFYQKHKNAPYLKSEKKRRKIEKKTKRINKRSIKNKKKAYKKLKKLDKKFFKNRGRHLKSFTQLKNVRRQEKIADKVKKKQIKKPDKLTKKKRNVNDKLYKLRNKSLLSKATGATVHSAKSSVRNKVLRDSGENNDSVKAVETIGTVVSKIKGNPQQRYNRKLKHYSKREEKLHKKSANKRFKKQNSKFDKKKSKKSKKTSNIKKKKKTLMTIIRPGSKFGLAVIALVMPLLLIPMLLSSCVGLFGNEGTFRFVTSYYGAKDSDLSDAAEYYQKLAHDLNQFVLSIPIDWKNHLDVLNIPANYTDDPTNFTFGNNNRLPSNPSYDYDRHKLYAFLCAYLYVANEDGSIKKWYFDENVEAILDNLFVSQYQFKSYYDNSSHWLLLSPYNDIAPGAYYSASDYGALIWNDSEGNFSHARGYFDGIGCSYIAEYADATGRIYYDLSNGEILNANNNYAATGWYFQNQSYDTVDGSGTTYDSWYEYDSLLDKYKYTDLYGNVCYKNYTGKIGYIIDGEVVENNYVVSQLDWYNYNKPEYNYYNKLRAGMSRADVNAEMQANGHTNSYVRILQKYERVNECTLYYSVNSKCTFDEAIYNALMALEDGEERYAYYKLLYPDSSRYYGMHQIGKSPVYYGYRSLLEYGYFLHGYSYEMNQWNECHCQFCNNDIQHSGIDIIQNSGSNVYAMIDGEIAEVGNGWFALKGYSNNREDKVGLYILYCNVDTSVLNVGQTVTSGEVITKTTNLRCEIKHSPYYIGNVELIGNDVGSDYLSITIYAEEIIGSLPILIDPELIISLSDNI